MPVFSRLRLDWRRFLAPAGLSGFAALVTLSGVVLPAVPPAAQAQVAPTGTSTATRTATASATPAPSATRTPSPTATLTPSPSPSASATSSPTHTSSPAPTTASSATAIPVTSTAASSGTPSSTSTPAPASSATATAPAASSATSTSPAAPSPTGTGSLRALATTVPCERASGNPATRWEEAFACMSTVSSARITSTQKQTTGSGASAQVRESTTSATLSGGDADVTHTRPAAPTPTVRPGGRVTVPSNGSNRRRVDVGGNRFDKDENASSAARRDWQQQARPTPAANTKPFGPLTLADGTSLGAASLYTQIRNQGTEDLTQGRAHRLEATVDMAALARAGRLSSAEQTR